MKTLKQNQIYPIYIILLSQIKIKIRSIDSLQISSLPRYTHI